MHVHAHVHTQALRRGALVAGGAVPRGQLVGAAPPQVLWIVANEPTSGCTHTPWIALCMLIFLSLPPPPHPSGIRSTRVNRRARRRHEQRLLDGAFREYYAVEGARRAEEEELRQARVDGDRAFCG